MSANWLNAKTASIVMPYRSAILPNESPDTMVCCCGSLEIDPNGGGVVGTGGSVVVVVIGTMVTYAVATTDGIVGSAALGASEPQADTRIAKPITANGVPRTRTMPMCIP